jgi:multidrug efflux system membrane fusion protein
MRKSKFLAASVVVLAVGAGAYLGRDKLVLGTDAAGAATPNPGVFAMPVPVVKVLRKSIPIALEYSARTESIRDIALQAKVSGYVQAQAVPDGSDVRKGDLLYKIDPRDYQAALDQALAQVQRDTAALDYARSNAARGAELGRNGNLAKDTVEQRASAERQAEAALAMDRAAVRTAQLNLDYTEVRAPFDGRLGRNQAPIGTLVGAAGAALNTLVQIDPLYVTFNPSETDLARIQAARAEGTVRAEVYVPGHDGARHVGKLTFLDNNVDRATGTITARVTIGNTDKSWLPGQYVRVRLVLGEQPDALLVPQTALGSSQLGKYLYVVGKENKVDRRLVSLGPTDGASVAIVKGVAEGDQVITGNLQKIGPGVPVQPMMR